MTLHFGQIPLARLTKKKERRPNKIKNEQGYIKIITTEIKRIKDCHEQLSANKLDYLGKSGLIPMPIRSTKTES